MNTLSKKKFLYLQKEENNYQISESYGKRMTEISCKIKCEKRRYFRSCSDLF